jgi:hypothetical protein
MYSCLLFPNLGIPRNYFEICGYRPEHLHSRNKTTGQLTPWDYRASCGVEEALVFRECLSATRSPQAGETRDMFQTLTTLTSRMVSSYIPEEERTEKWTLPWVGAQPSDCALASCWWEESKPAQCSPSCSRSDAGLWQPLQWQPPTSIYKWFTSRLLLSFKVSCCVPPALTHSGYFAPGKWVLSWVPGPSSAKTVTLPP